MRGKLFLLSFLSAGLLAAAWPPWGYAPLLFIAFLPLLCIQEIISKDDKLKGKHIFLYGFLTFFVWNALTTWWIWYASEFGAVMATMVNTILMSFTFLIFHKVKSVLPDRIGRFFLIPAWITFEFLHHHGELSWPWMTLGNGFANQLSWIQWYEFTGVFGGSFWALTVNVLLVEILLYKKTLAATLARKRLLILSLSVIIFIPIIISYLISNNYKIQENNVTPINVTILQPNIDPYKKFNSDFQEMTEQMLLLAETKIDSTTDYLVFPETALVESIWENNINNSWTIHRLQKFLKKYPKLKIVSGANTAYEFSKGEKHSATTRKFLQEDSYYDSYNTALQIDSTKTIQVYHKSKLVPGTEKMPFIKHLKFLEQFALDLGGTTGSLGMQEERTVFVSPNSTSKIASVICYESIYGQYVSEYIQNGADFIFILTNDGWWSNTAGHKQHLKYASLRAIETRKSIARSANTGVTCFIDQLGTIHQAQKWWTASVIKQTMYSKVGTTFYTRNGDYIAISMLLISISGMLFGIAKYIRKKLAKVDQKQIKIIHN